MIIVIDLSKKLVGYNLFQSFFYDLKNKGALVFANDPLTVDDNGVDFDALRENISNILYDRHASLWSVCVLYDMNDKKDDPIRNSIVANIHEIKENIIKPLSSEYSFHRLYYFLLDDIRRNYDDIPAEENVSFAIDFDSMGYVRDTMESGYLDIVFTEREVNYIEWIWNEIKAKYVTSDQIAISSPKSVISEFNKSITQMFNSKINVINKKYPDLRWYAKRLRKVEKAFLSEFENVLLKNASSINSIDNPSNAFKNLLKNNISTYREHTAVILHVDLLDKTSMLNREVLKFRHHLEIMAMLIYLATNDTKRIFEAGQNIDRENHWNITAVIDDKNLAKMLYSYNSKLKMELEKLGKFVYNEIEYEEFSPRQFNLALEMKKPKLPATPFIGIFSKKNEAKHIASFAESLFGRYREGVAFSNRRMRELTTKLRVQKEADAKGKIKKANVIDITQELEKMRNDIKGLQKELAFYKPQETVPVNEDIKKEYDGVVDGIAKLLNRRIKASTFLKNELLIVGVSVCTYPILQLVGVPNIRTFWGFIAMIIFPALIYSVLQICNLILLRKEITRELQNLINSNEQIVKKMFENDNEEAKYIQGIYNLIMEKKYVDDCSAKVIASNQKLNQFNYHHDKLKEHAEISDRLMELLGIDTAQAELIPLEKISGVQDVKNVETNTLYCPLSYLQVAEAIKNKAVINNEQTIDIDSNLIGFIEKFVIVHDKEYRHD